MNPKVKELGVSFIRTSIVPPLAGFIGAWLVKHNITQIEQEWVFALTTLVLSGVWYLLFRAIEIISERPKVMKWAGIFLGYDRVRDEQLVPPVEVKEG